MSFVICRGKKTGGMDRPICNVHEGDAFIESEVNFFSRRGHWPWACIITYSSLSTRKISYRSLQVNSAACRCIHKDLSLRSIQVHRSRRHSLRVYVCWYLRKNRLTLRIIILHLIFVIDANLLPALRAFHSSIESCTALSILESSSYSFCCCDWLDFAYANISEK